MIEPRDLALAVDAKPVVQRAVDADVRTLKEAKDKVEKEMVVFALDKHAGNIAKAAEELGVSRPTLYDIMKKHGLYNDLPHQESMGVPGS
jgi:two-component system NtrC family response regulator